ncbi:hypothetical protein [Limnovirga soli]|jgi:hypothetical protein|uniref:Uncharacterized protein n=1 Tax=Limnovirga soli TaxID=2656915 RepID=A0A8J8FCP4_9BACT|nr:hypothetical protein [Limnovirga soli]NNV54143.1 hypothetical protein [Limnovirga soli]
MSHQNRDLLVLTKRDSMNPEELEHEVELLVDILFHVENLDAFCVANEIIDLNKYKIIQKPLFIKQFLREKNPKPFVFINNRN